MKAKKKSFILIYLVPTLLLYVIFCIYPCTKSLVLSVCHWNGVSPDITFVGLDNFKRMMSDPIVWKAFGNNLFILVFCTLFTFSLSLAFAIFVTGKKQNIGRLLE